MLKVFVRDSGLLHALLGIATRRDLENHPKVGTSWEGYAVEEEWKLSQDDITAQVLVNSQRFSIRRGIDIFPFLSPEIKCPALLGETHHRQGRHVVLFNFHGNSLVESRNSTSCSNSLCGRRALSPICCTWMVVIDLIIAAGWINDKQGAFFSIGEAVL